MDGGSGANHRIYGSANGYGGNGGGINGEDGKGFSNSISQGGKQDGPGMQDDKEDACYNGKFGKGGDGSANLQQAALACGGGGGYYGGTARYLAGGGGSGHINFHFLKYAKTTTSSHTGNGECKITLLSNK